MKVARERSLRFLVDLQACQTKGSARRGVGRYSQALFDGLMKQAGGYSDIQALISTDLPYQPILDSLPANKIIRLPKLPEWDGSRSWLGGQQDHLSALVYDNYTSRVSPDIMHVSHVFEGFERDIALPSVQHRPAGQIVTATLYDLIPLIYPEHYLANEHVDRWYRQRMNWLRNADLLLSISESSRQDAIELLGISPERIVTIHGGVGPQFCLPVDRAAVRANINSRYKFDRKFVLYTGGDDYRKNIAGAIAGFALVPAEVRQQYCFVIVCAMEDHRREMYLEQARKLGISADDILITGYVSEEDLVAFYQACDVFVFPSTYEGLGFPVIEAMACGAPVIGGDNSSISELVGRKDAMFDATKHASIAEAMHRVMSDDHFAAELRDFAAAHVRQFTWEATTARALEAFSEGLARSRADLTTAVSVAALPAKRLAILTPLPPCRSGIADYNAAFLPYLSRHFEIDLYVDGYAVSDRTLTSCFSIFDISEFEAVAENYDAILYEFGNSEFHAHMLPLLEKYPGVVGLHDAFLSGLIGYLDFHLGDTGSYYRTMLEQHGPRARQFFAPSAQCKDGNSASMIALPCTKHVLDNALGVISHSAFNLDVANEAYPEGWKAPYSIIPQMVKLPRPQTDAQRSALRKEMGYGDTDVIVTTFGHVAWTKWGDRLVEAFETDKIAKNKKIQLIFAGELAGDAFGKKLKKQIKAAGLSSRVKITGYLSDEDYEKHLRVTDIGIQLRKNSRGGTPKGVLDCLAHQVPVIVNNDASYRDYPDDVVAKVPAEPSVEEIADTIATLAKSPKGRTKLAQTGFDYVRQNHDPEACAAGYAAAIHEFYERHKHGTDRSTVKMMAPYIARSSDPNAVAQQALRWIEERPLLNAFATRRLLIDVSHLYGTDHETGIPRVVKELLRELMTKDRAGFDPVPVRLADGKLVRVPDLLSRLGVIPVSEAGMASASGELVMRQGDILLMLDSSWHRIDEFVPVFETARANYVPVYTAVYDLLPLKLPPDCIVQGGKDWFHGWLMKAITQSDGLIGISRSVADDLHEFIEAMPDIERKPKIGYWHLGANFSDKPETGTPASSIVSAAGRKPYMLMVGTIEPRKSHQFTLDVFEGLWDQGSDLCLCIAGKEGWMVDKLMKRIHSHRELGKRLMFFDRPSDDDIRWLYQNAQALLFPSKGEGFGLPLVEAAHFGTPIVCSDLPVFREIAGEFATYIDHLDSDRAREEILNWYRLRQSGGLPDTKDMPILTWRESASQLLNVVFDQGWTRS